MESPTEIRDGYNREGLRDDLVHLKDFARWNYISPEDWTELCCRTSDFVGIEDGDDLFEAGCGSGAFLNEVDAYRDVRLAGVDFAENLVEIARSSLTGDFRVADITDMSFIEADRFDKVLAHGVFLYLDTVDSARSAAREMIRIARPGGKIYVGIVNDPDRSADYEHPPSGSFILPRSFWRGLAAECGLELEIVDQDQIFARPTGYDCYSRIRYSVLLQKPLDCPRAHPAGTP